MQFLRVIHCMKEQIKQHVYDKGILSASQAFNLSPYKIRNLIGGWTREDQRAFLARQRVACAAARKIRRRLKENQRLAQPHIKGKTLARLRQYRLIHVFKSLASKHQLSYLDLYSIAKHQKLICPYTGMKLTRETISVEHVIPISRGGTNHRDNLMLVHVWANKMKLNHSLDEFKAMIAKIYFALGAVSTPT